MVSDREVELEQIQKQLKAGKISSPDFELGRRLIEQRYKRRSPWLPAKLAGIFLASLVMLIVFVAITRSPTEETYPTRVGPEGPGIAVSAMQYGDDWPFPFNQASLTCQRRTVGGIERPVVTLEADDRVVALNGFARGLEEYEDYQRYMWPRDPVTGAFVKGVRTVSSLIDKAIAQCG